MALPVISINISSILTVFLNEKYEPENTQKIDFGTSRISSTIQHCSHLIRKLANLSIKPAAAGMDGRKNSREETARGGPAAINKCFLRELVGSLGNTCFPWLK